MTITLAANPSSHFGLYTGSTLGALAPVSGTASAGSFAFDAVASTTYRLAVDGGIAGTPFRLDWTSPPLNDAFANAIMLTESHGSVAGTSSQATSEPGEPSVGMDHTQQSAWYTFTPATTGILHTWPQNDDGFEPDAAVFTGTTVSSLSRVPNSWGFLPGKIAAFTAVAGTTYRIQIEGSGPFFMRWRLVPPNDAFAGALALTGRAGELQSGLGYATTEAGEPNLICDPRSPCGWSNPVVNSDGTLWWRLAAASAGGVSLDTFGSTQRTSLAVFTGNALESLTPVAATGPSEPPYSHSSLSFVAAAGTTYYVRVGTTVSTDGSYQWGAARLHWHQYELPGAPTNATGTPGNTQVSVSWLAPSSDGGSPITGYTVTATPGGKSCAWTTGPLSCVVTGLSNGTPYVFTVHATTAVGSGPESASSPPVTPSTVPGAPTGAAATPGDSSAAVAWIAPVSNGGAAITSYTVTSNPEGKTCTAAGTLACLVTGLTNATPYTFTVTATNAAGTGPASAPTAATTPLAPASGPKFHALTPARILDTRPGPDQTGLAGKFGPAQARTLQVTGHGGVPAGATAVVVNVTAVLPSAPSFLSITPEAPAPGSPITTSSLNLTPGTVRPNLVMAKLGTGGHISIFNNSGTVDVLADVVGWFDDGTIPGDVLTALTPTRILDTRAGPEQAGLAGSFGAAQARVLQVAGTGGVPIGASAVVMNVTSVGPSSDSFLSLTPDTLSPGAVPGTSNLNLATGQVRPNLVVVKLNTSGQVTVFNNSGTVDVLGDVVGYFSTVSGGVVTSVSPVRILDTRPGSEQTGLTGKFGPAQARVLQIAGRGGVPSDAKAVWLNVTSVNPSADSFLSLVPNTLLPGQVPNTSNLNLSTGTVVPNLVFVKLDDDGRVTIYNNSGNVDVLADTVAYVR